MTFNAPDQQTRSLLQSLQAQGRLPRGLTPEQTARLAKALSRYSGEVSQRVLNGILADFQDKLKAASAMATPDVQRGLIADLTRYVGSEEIAQGIRFALKISQEVAAGAGLWLNQNLTPEAVDEYPALAFQRLFQRDVPRGLKLGRKGALMAVPDDDWPSRWAAAGDAAGDDGWRDWQGDAQTGRGVALKSSGLWQALGDGAGGYDDALGNPYPPFAFNSGFMTLEVSRAEAVQLGLIGADEPAQPARIDTGKLFAEVPV